MSVEHNYPEIRSLIRLGREKGFVIHDDVLEHIPEDLKSDPNAFDDMLILLEDYNILVFEDDEYHDCEDATLKMKTFE